MSASQPIVQSNSRGYDYDTEERVAAAVLEGEDLVAVLESLADHSVCGIAYGPDRISYLKLIQRLTDRREHFRASPPHVDMATNHGQARDWLFREIPASDGVRASLYRDTRDSRTSDGKRETESSWMAIAVGNDFEAINSGIFPTPMGACRVLVEMYRAKFPIAPLVIPASDQNEIDRRMEADELTDQASGLRDAVKGGGI